MSDEHEQDEEVKLPFSRWAIKLIVEKLLAPVIVPALTAALTAAGGWYAIGQYHVDGRVREEVLTHEAVRDMIQDAIEDEEPAPATTPDPDPEPAPLEDPPGHVVGELPDIETLRTMWEKRTTTQGAQRVQAQFPRELVEEELRRLEAKKK